MGLGGFKDGEQCSALILLSTNLLGGYFICMLSEESDITSIS